MSDAGFSVSMALGTPFRLTRKRPLMVLVWGLTMVLFGVVCLALILPMMAGFTVDQTMANDSAAMDALMASMIQMQAVSALLNLGQLGLSLILWAAITRATLAEGLSDKWFFLRLSMDEVWLLIVGVALFIGLYAAMLVLILFGAAIGFGVWGLGEPTNIIVIMGVGAAFLIVLLIGMARVSLIAPAFVFYRRLAFPEGWRLAKGQTGRLFLLMLAVWAVYLVIYALIAAVFIGVIVASGGFVKLNDATTLTDILPSAGTIILWIAVAALPLSVISGFVLTLFVSPFASACQQLVRRQQDPSEFAVTAR